MQTTNITVVIQHGQIWCVDSYNKDPSKPDMTAKRVSKRRIKL